MLIVLVILVFILLMVDFFIDWRISYLQNQEVFDENKRYTIDDLE